jgi:putative colanic acid biosynthesis acetyltransferase WcaF
MVEPLGQPDPAVASTKAMPKVDLSRFDKTGFRRGRPALVEALWILVQAMLVSSFLPGSAHRRTSLRLFGAKIGQGVVLKPGIKVKFPWRLSIGDNSWIGEDVWIDNLAEVHIGDNVCISQGAYLCTGSHNWSGQNFDLTTSPIRIGSGAWIAARCAVGPGVEIGEGSVLTLGSVAVHRIESGTIHQGNPAAPVRSRKISESK